MMFANLSDEQLDSLDHLLNKLFLRICVLVFLQNQSVHLVYEHVLGVPNSHFLDLCEVIAAHCLLAEDALGEDGESQGVPRNVVDCCAQLEVNTAKPAVLFSHESAPLTLAHLQHIV